MEHHEDANPPRLSRAFNEEIMSGWSPSLEVSSYANATGHVKTLWKTCRNGVRSLSWLDVLFLTGIMFPAVTIMRNDQ